MPSTFQYHGDLGMAASKYAVESIGTFFLVSAIGLTTIDPGGAGAWAPVAIAATLIGMIYAGGHISWAHYNPAVTVAMTIRGKCFVADAIPYIVVQCVGAAAAAFLVLYLKSGAKIEPRTFVPIPALIAEALFTFAMVFVILNVASAKANANGPGAASLRAAPRSDRGRRGLQDVREGIARHAAV
jgi:aquaporin Z